MYYNVSLSYLQFRTSFSCHRRTRAMRCITSIVLHTKVDAQCDKQTTVVDRTKLTTRDGGCGVPEFGTKFQMKYAYFREFPNSLITRWRINQG